MAFCSTCGKEVNDAAVVCVHCGCSTGNKAALDDAPNFGYALLGFCFPIVGLILFLVWKDTKPLNAKMAGKGALACLIFAIVCYALIFIVAMLGA